LAALFLIKRQSSVCRDPSKSKWLLKSERSDRINCSCNKVFACVETANVNKNMTGQNND